MTTKPTTVIEAALFMDDNHPGWHNNIDINKLNMADGDNCIFGQLYGHYLHGLSKYHIHYYFNDINPFGLHADRGQWIQQIKERLALGTFKWAFGRVKEGKKVRRKSWPVGKVFQQATAISSLLCDDVGANNWELVPDEPVRMSMVDLKFGDDFVFDYQNDKNPCGRISMIMTKVQIYNASHAQYWYYDRTNHVICRDNDSTPVRKM